MGHPRIEVLQLAVKMSHTPEQVAAVENVLENLRKYDAVRSKLRAENKMPFCRTRIPKDEAQGMALLERAARSGYAQAQFQMGEHSYGDGNAVENYVAAYIWYTQAQRFRAS